ncbi:MAG: HPF/RaiA family ribosome-associated protein, partial [Kofleriaceae bacterium]
MQIPTEITFHGLDHSDAVEASVQRWIARLELFCDRITKCAVVVGRPHKRHRHGSDFVIQLLVDVPGAEIVAHAGHVDIYVAIADAFRAAKRQLHDRIDARRSFAHAGAR